MKIALFHNLPSGGGKRAVFEWLERLSARHTVDVFTLETADHNYCDLRPCAREHNVYPFQTRKLFDSPFGRLNQLQRWQDLRELDRLNERVAGDIDAGGYDVVFANTCMFTFVPALLKYLQTPSVYYLHEPFGPSFTRSFQRPYNKSVSWRTTLDRYDLFIRKYHALLLSLQNASLRKATCLLSNSQFTKEQMILGFGVDSFMCHLGVDIDLFNLIDNVVKENLIVSVGELSPRKGFDFLVESVGKMSLEKRPQLMLACNNILEQEYGYILSLADRWKVDLQVLKNLNTQQLTMLYNKARLCVYSPVLEPFGLVPLEAMACGTPVVGVCEGGVPESVVHGSTGLLIERDSERFGAAIEGLIADPDLAKEYGRKGREHVVSNWTWESSVATLEKYLLDTAKTSH